MLPFESQKCKLTSRYAYRTHPITGVYKFHPGIDLVGIDTTNGDGEKIVAVHDGTVARSRIVTDKSNATWEWGNYIAITGTDGVTIYYCHLQHRLVQAGTKVKAGDVIGIEGATGQATGVHLHFECRRGTTPIDPAEYLGIANAAGTYEGTKVAIEKLAKAKVINTPDYWNAHHGDVEYLDKLIIRAADKIKTAGAPSPNLEAALSRLVIAGVINTPDYWRANANKVQYLPELICKLGGSI